MTMACKKLIENLKLLEKHLQKYTINPRNKKHDVTIENLAFPQNIRFRIYYIPLFAQYGH